MKTYVVGGRMDVQKDLHLIYSISIEDIRFAKKQQWQISFYALALMVGLAFLQGTSTLPYWLTDIPLFKNIFNVLISAVALAGILLLLGIERDIRKYRTRVQQVRNKLSPQAQEILKLERGYTLLLYKWYYAALLCGTIAIAGVLLLIVSPWSK
jgi:hypothetical protein